MNATMKRNRLASLVAAVLLWDGRVMADLSAVDVAEALGAHTRPSRDRYDVVQICRDIRLTEVIPAPTNDPSIGFYRETV